MWGSAESENGRSFGYVNNAVLEYLREKVIVAPPQSREELKKQ